MIDIALPLFFVSSGCYGFLNKIGGGETLLLFLLFISYFLDLEESIWVEVARPFRLGENKLLVFVIPLVVKFD